MYNGLFALAALLLSYLIYIYPLFLLSHLLADTPVFHFSSIILSLAVAAIVLIYLRTHLSSIFLRRFIYYGMGLGFLAFWIFNLGFLSALFLPEWKAEIGIAACVLFAGVSSYSIYQGTSLKTKQLTFHSPKITDPQKLIFISDVHIGSNPKSHLEKICYAIQQMEYDALLIGGDLFDSSAFQPDELSPLRTIERPIYYVSGNHEYYVKNYREKLQSLQQFNITFLDNQSAKFGQINLMGVSDKQSPATQYAHTQALIHPDKYNLLLAHQPSIWNDVAGAVDFMISGHTHNGQIFPFNMLVRMQFETVYGLFSRENSHLYVSSGSGTWGPRMRLGTQNEIVQIDILPR